MYKIIDVRNALKAATLDELQIRAEDVDFIEHGEEGIALIVMQGMVRKRVIIDNELKERLKAVIMEGPEFIS